VLATSSTQLTGWTVTPPYFNNTTFDPATGEFEVPETGTYLITATINYEVDGTIDSALAPGVTPYFVVRRTSPVVTELISGELPVFEVDLAGALKQRVILANSEVTLAGEVELNAGDIVGLFYEDDTMTLGLNLGSIDKGIFWSITRLS